MYFFSSTSHLIVFSTFFFLRFSAASSGLSFQVSFRCSQIRHMRSLRECFFLGNHRQKMKHFDVNIGKVIGDMNQNFLLFGANSFVDTPIEEVVLFVKYVRIFASGSPIVPLLILLPHRSFRWLLLPNTHCLP